MRKIAILGSTGSIGTQTLEVVEANPERFSVEVLTANNHVDLLIEQALKFHPDSVVIANEEKYPLLRDALQHEDIKVFAGADALARIVTFADVDLVVTALVGYSGLIPTVNAIKAGKNIALANKETLVVAGELVNESVAEHRVAILPVDSEHSAIFQCLAGEVGNPIEKVILTASGGPFRGWKREQLEKVQVEDALKHPNWSMGHKITIDSSTMVNKGLEVMEAGWLFDVSLDQIQVVIQPASIIHSMIEYEDGAVIAQLGTPDMKLPIQYALYYPERRFLPGDRLDFTKLREITFDVPDPETFKGLKLAYQAGKTGGSMPTVFNAANEMAVSLFLKKKIPYLTIPDMIQASMEHHKKVDAPDVDQILAAEAETYDFIHSKWNI